MMSSNILRLSIFHSIIAFTTLLDFAYGSSDDDRIIRGRDALIGEFPFQALVSGPQIYFCGGVIIDDDVVLTAGHCCLDTPKDINVSAGMINRNSQDKQTVSVKSFIQHPKFELPIFKNDVCILLLEKKFIFDNKKIGSIKLGDLQNCKTGALCQVSGWGVSEKPGPLNLLDLKMTPNLKFASVPILPNKECSSYTTNKMYFNNISNLCAGIPKFQVDSCQGDSGGPLSCNQKLCGLVSNGKDCALKKFPGIYTNITHFSKWIKNQVRKYKEAKH